MAKVHESTNRKKQWIINNNNHNRKKNSSFQVLIWFHLIFDMMWMGMCACVCVFFSCSYCSFGNIKIIRSRSRKFKSLILLNIHAKCEQKKIDLTMHILNESEKKSNFFCWALFADDCVALFECSVKAKKKIKCRRTDAQTESESEHIRIHRWNGPYEYVNKWFFIQFTKQI